MTAILSPDELKLAAAIKAMEERRKLAELENDLLLKAEIDDWFRRHAPVIRPIRDKLEGEWD